MPFFEHSGYEKVSSCAYRLQYCSDKCREEAESGSNSCSSNSQYSQSNSTNTGIFGKISGAIDNSTERKEVRLENRVDSIATMNFGSSPEELSNGLNQLVTMGAGSKDTDIRKAIAEKMEFMIMQLRNSGKSSEADFFETKRKKISPKWYE